VRRIVKTSILAAIAPLALAACGSGAKTPTTTTATACVRVREPALKPLLRLSKPKRELTPGLAWKAIVQTNCGTFTIALDTADSPKTTSSFASLARHGFYDRLTFHRIAAGFVIQGGDPLGSGRGGPGYTIREAPPKTTRYTHGVVAMAKLATDEDGTSGSQFFIVTGPDAQLPPQYALLGRVTSGIDVVDRIDGLPLKSTDPQGSEPVNPVVIEHVEITDQ
jgi:cyclophilin family peptidyl-prolyl cis-trans isomerase